MTYLDIVEIETNHPMTNPRPAWVNETVMAKIVDLRDLSTKFLFNDDTRRRLRGGSTLNEIIQRMEEVTWGNSSLNYMVYSVHDFKMVALLETLGAYASNPKCPRFATAIVVELHENPVGKYYVEVHHYNETGSSRVVPVSIAGCATPCTLAQFKQRSQVYIPGDWDKECGNK